MYRLLRVLIAGTVMNLIAVPFLFGQDFRLSLKEPVKKETAITTESKGLLPACTYVSAGRRFAWNDKLIDTGITKLKDSTFTTKPVTEKKFRMKKKVWLAVLLSAGLPGAGQFYNQSYWKIPIIDGFVGYFLYEYIREDKNFRNYRDQYAASQTPQFPEGDDNLKTLREFYRSQRNNFTWYFLIVYFINLVDAYVDAHLFDFDVKDNKLSSGVVDRKVNLNVHIPLK
jgi:hypothetical protein